MMSNEQAAIGMSITRTRYDAEAEAYCVVIETIRPRDFYADEPVGPSSDPIALAPPETEKPRKLHEDMTLDDWRRGIANSSRQYHGT